MINRNRLNKELSFNPPMSGLRRDRDGDGYPDIIDCQPNNPRKQGWIHDLAAKGKEKYEQYKTQKAAEESAREDVRHGRVSEKDVDEKYTYDSPQRRAAKEQFLKQKVQKIREEEREKRVLKEARTQAKGGSSSGLFNNVSSKSSSVLNYLVPPSKPSIKKKGLNKKSIPNIHGEINDMFKRGGF